MNVAAHTPGATVANAVVLNARTQHGRKAFDLHARHGRSLVCIHHIANAPALNAAHMLVTRDIAVKPLGRSGSLKTANFTAIGQKVQITVNSAEADSGQALAHDTVKLIRSGMAFVLAQLFQNHRALAGHSCLNLGHISLHLIVKITVTVGCCQAQINQEAKIYAAWGLCQQDDHLRGVAG